MHVKYRQDNLYRMTWYTGMCAIMAMGLLYMLALWLNAFIIWALDPMLFVASVALMGGYYRMEIISGVSHPRSDLVMSLMLFTVACNG